MFLDSCAINKQELDLDVLDKDIDEIIEDITKCLSTVQSSQIRLKKMLNKVSVKEDNAQSELEEESVASVIKIEDKDPEIRDEVFYCVKTDDEIVTSPVGDIITGPGKKEKENSKVVLTELKRKLVKREDLMRERERQALAKTMPELQNIPEFPRQIPEEFVERKGLIFKLERKKKPVKLFKQYHIMKHVRWRKKYDYFKVRIQKYESDSELPCDVVKANTLKLFKKKNVPNVFLSIMKVKFGYFIALWRKSSEPVKKEFYLSSEISNGSSEAEDSPENNNTSENDNINRQKKISHLNDFKFSKKDLELSPSSSETDFENLHNEKVALLDDIRRHRVARKKNFPARRASIDNADESLKPIEYSFGTGMAMASVLQVNNKAKLPNMLQEEVFIGDGEVSNDSGNDEDA